LKTLPRDLSWLRFNARVLQEAQCPTVPLLERLKFLAIFSSNLDEFFKVRVATLRRLVKLKKKTRAQLPQDRPKRLLAEVLTEVQRQQEEFGRTYREELLPDLREAGICLTSAEELSDKQREWVQTYFEEKVRDLLSPVVLDETMHQLFLKDQAVYLTFHLTKPRTGKKKKGERVVLLELPTKRHGGRFVALPGTAGTPENPHCVLFLDDVVRVGAASLFPNYEGVEVNAIKLSRDAELDIEEEVSGDLLAKIRSSLAKRATGYPARLLYDPEMPKAVVQAIKLKTGIEDEELVEGSRYHNFRDFFGFPSFGRTDLLNPDWPELPHPTLPRTGALLPAIAQRDHLLHPPYQSFDVVPRLLREAAADPRVSAISITLYRVASKSAVVKALLKAVKNGKQVTAVVELKARFDEESNMFWAEKLQRAGAHVIFTPAELKCHAKLLLITRREGPDESSQRRYAYLSSGNFNEATASLYTDHALLTGNAEIAAEVDQVFRYFVTGEEPSRLRHLLVAPFTLRKQLLKLIAAEADRARKGEAAYMIIKVNSLEDPGMIAALYEASQAGVRVELLIRGIGCLVPGEPGLSETITQRGLIDRNLEHSRIYVFGNGGEEKVYVSSADWMTRNLDRRVEAAFPLLDETLRAEVRHLLDLERQDNVKARDFNNHLFCSVEGEPLVRTQEAQYQYLKKLATKRRAPKARALPPSSKKKEHSTS
jgi:polyphosphate kinase